MRRDLIPVYRPNADMTDDVKTVRVGQIRHCALAVVVGRPGRVHLCERVLRPGRDLVPHRAGAVELEQVVLEPEVACLKVPQIYRVDVLYRSGADQIRRQRPGGDVIRDDLTVHRDGGAIRTVVPVRGVAESAQIPTPELDGVRDVRLVHYQYLSRQPVLVLHDPDVTAVRAGYKIGGVVNGFMPGGC